MLSHVREGKGELREDRGYSVSPLRDAVGSLRKRTHAPLELLPEPRHPVSNCPNSYDSLHARGQACNIVGGNGSLYPMITLLLRCAEWKTFS